jgi:hypothetical protein
MATVKSTTFAAQEAGKMALDAGIANVGLHVIATSYEASSLAANDIINLFKLPKGAVIYGMDVYFDDLGTGTTLDVGDSNDVDRYIDGADTATAAGAAHISLADAIGYRIGTNAGDDVVTAKNLGASATGTIKVVCTYAL